MTPPPSTKPPLQRLKVDLEKDDEKIAAAVSKSRHIVLDFPLVKDHRAKSAPHGGYSKIGRLFPTAFIVEVLPPFLIVRVRTLPPKPWPLTVGRLPLKLTTSPNEDCFDCSQGGYGLQIFKHINVRKDRDAYHHDLLAEVIGYFQNASIKLRTIAWFYGFWMVSLVDEVDPKLLPSTIGRAIVFYNFNVPELISSGLKKTVPTGTVFDNNCYVVNEDSVLRPGIQLSSSLVNGQNRLTTSGVKVLDKHNNVFITGAAHGFNVDGEVYHPDHNGIHIGDVVTVLDDLAAEVRHPARLFLNLRTMLRHRGPWMAVILRRKVCID
jgi:hypothetical protein